MFELLEVKKWRYERKFAVSILDKYEIEAQVKFHPAIFSEIFTERTINNIYLDWPGLNNFWENVNGQSQRVKVRIRWYGNHTGFIDKPVLEIKIKNGHLGGKLSFPLTSFTLNQKLKQDEIVALIGNSGIPNILKPDFSNLQFSLCNSYKRKYFLSSDKHFRVTIDSELTYYALQSRENVFAARPQKGRDIIVEMKYDQEFDDKANHISNLFLFRSTKSSKYVEGVKSVNAIF